MPGAETPTRPRALFLCSGTGSVGRPFREANWEVVDVDWDGRFGAEIVADILTWDYGALPPGHFDVVWASPNCVVHSTARARARTPRDLDGAGTLAALWAIRLSWPLQSAPAPEQRGWIGGGPNVNLTLCTQDTVTTAHGL